MNLSGRTLTGLTPGYGNKRKMSLTDLGMFMNNGLRYGQGMSATRTLTKQRRPRYAQRNSFAKRVRSIQPAKHYSVETAITVLNTLIYTQNITAGITQGDLNSQRDGDSIYLEAIPAVMF